MFSPPRRAASGFVVAAVLTVAVFASTPRPAPADGIMLVQAGAFWMGPDDGEPDEAPLHRVYVRDFWIERQKVTNAEFATFLDARGAMSPEGERRYAWDDPDARVHRTGSRWSPDPGFEGHPVADASWFGARDFCAWRGRRLPTEAEWEKTARGDGRSHPSGNPYGVAGLLVAPREWTSTALRPYPYRADDGREPWNGAGRVVMRGIGSDDGAAAPSVTRRRSDDPRGAAATDRRVGFRCATSEDLGEMAPGRR